VNGDSDRPHVLITHGPDDIVKTAYLMRPGEHRLWIASSAVHDDILRRAREVARKEGVPVVEDPSFVPLPPLEPKWMRPYSSRLLMEIPSVPELRSYLNKCLAYFLLFGEGTDGEYRALTAVTHAEQALQDAQWRLACASWRWQRRPAPLDEHIEWEARQELAALYFECRHEPWRRGVPGKEVVRRIYGRLSPGREL
jgi:hypothetical protein